MSIATRIQSMEEHISDAYDSLNKMGVTTNDKNIENIAGLVDQIYENAPKTDYVSGTNLTIENTLKGKLNFKDTDNIEKIGLGATDQYTTTGKNLCNEEFVQGTFNGTTTTRISCRNIELKANTTYTLSSNLNYSNFNISAVTSTNQFPIQPSETPSYDSGWKSATFSFTTGTDNVYCNIAVRKSDNSNITPNEVDGIHFQLEQGSSATSYEKYSGGTASPNPSYSQDVNVVTGSIGIKTSNKNLIENETFVQGAAYESVGTKRISCRNIKLKANTTYTFSSNINYSTYNVAIETSTSQFPTSPYIYDSGWKTATFSFTTGNDDVYCNITVKKVGELVIAPSDVAGYHFQIEKGTTATSYVKHYEQEYELNLRKNLFNKDDAQIIHAWFLKASTAISVNSGNDTIVYIPCQPNTTYTASKIQEPNQSKNTLVLGTTTTQPTNNTPLNVKEGQQGGTITEVTITTGPNDYYLCAFCYSKNDANTYNETEMLASLQIEEGSQATSYASYFPPIELCKINTYQDYIYKNGKNWYIHKEIGKIVLNGSETYVLDAELTTVNRFRLNITSYKLNYIASRGSGVCNQLKIANAYSQDDEHAYSYGNSSYMALYLFYNKTRCADVSGLQNWLNANNLIVYGLLNTPTETQITDENLIAQLEAWYNAQSMDDITYITVDGDLPMQLKLRALKK